MRLLLPLSILVWLSLCLPAQAPPALAANQPAAKAAGAASKKPIAVRDKWAILIGVNRYKDPILPPLKYAEKNVVDLSRLLVDPAVGRFAPDHVQSITGGGASKVRFNELIDTWLYKKALPGDMIVVYASTHVADNPGTGEAFLCLRDSMSTDPATGVPLLEFFKQVKQRTQANNVLLLLDTSYGGTAAAPDDKTLNALCDLGVSVIAANNIGGQSYEDATTQNSFFTAQLMEGLKAGGGQLPLKAIATHIKDTVSSQVQKALSKAQMPVFLPSRHLTDDQLPPIGVEVKAQNQVQAFGFGHPVDQLGLTRPDLVMPRTAGKPVQLPPAPPGKGAAQSDEDEDDVDHALDMRPYVAKMKSDIQKKWVPPKGLENRKLVAIFTIMRDGAIVRATIVESSGQADVDKSAMDALKAASPLDPLPKGAPRSVDIKYQFDWNITRGNAAGGN
jgi:TonB family protein